LSQPARSSTAVTRSSLAVLGLLGIWMLVATLSATRAAHRSLVPTPVGVATALWELRWTLWAAALATLLPAAAGFVLGNGAALLVGLASALSRRLEAASLRTAVALYSIPLAATGPILAVAVGGAAMKVLLAAQSCLLPTLVATGVGLRATGEATLEMARAFGAGRVTILRRIRLRVAVPFIAAGVQLSAPAALLGAMVGEFFGSDRGLGVLMVSAMARLEPEQAWAVGLVASGIAGAAWAFVGLAAGAMHAAPIGSAEVQAGLLSTAVPADRRLSSGLLAAAAVLSAWQVSIMAADLPAYFAKAPMDVWRFLTVAPQAAENRAVILDAFKVTLVDAAVGYTVGMAAAIGLSAAMVLWRPVERLAIPVIVVARAMPLIALAPLLVLVFGRSTGVVAVLVGLVVGIPGVVIITRGLRTVPARLLDLLATFDAPRPVALVKVRLPGALASICAAARIGAPNAVLGAVIAEWLATGDGLGYLMVAAASVGRFDVVWTAATVVTVASVAWYAAAEAVERRVASRTRW
jgi:sulfonate transport system permease protein